jgi:tetratricopeptide (TPR) repeat protein
VQGNVDRAIESFKKAAGQDPKYALAYAGLGEAYWRKTRATGEKQWATLANQNAEYAVQLDGNLAIVHSVLGSVYLDAGRLPEATREFQQAMELAPGNAEAPRQLAQVYNLQGRFDEAEALYVRSTKSRPTDWYGYLMLGLFYYERERYPEAEAQLNQAKTLTPDNDLVRLDLGAVYRMHGRYPEAIAEYQQALRIRSNAATYAGLGGAYYYEHRFQEAVAAVEAAIDLDSSDYRYWGNVGIYYRRVPGSEAKSEPALRRAIELATKIAENKKSDYNARANLAEYRARLGDAKGALAEIDRIPVTARTPLTTRLAIVYELTGHRNEAIALIRANLKSQASLNQIKDDPDLEALWREGLGR